MKRFFYAILLPSIFMLAMLAPAGSAVGAGQPGNHRIGAENSGATGPIPRFNQPGLLTQTWLSAAVDNEQSLLLAQAEDQVTDEEIREAGREIAQKRAELDEDADETGTDPRDFRPKFMPYYRHTKLENDLEIDELVLFGMFAFNPKFAMTYEWPMARRMDYSDVEGFERFRELGEDGQLPPNAGLPGAGGNLPFSDLSRSGKTVGMGDLGLRFFHQFESLRWRYAGGEKNFSIFPVLETTLPTATKDVLGGEAWILSPGITFVFDVPVKSPPFGLGFVASMNFYDFDVWKESSRSYTSRYRGRWFWMQPLSMPGHVKDPGDDSWHVFDLAGFYLMTEFQPIYDFKESEFSWWIGPELGKIIKEGYIFYAKPGWGIDNAKDSGDRDFTFETGFRYFF